MSITIGSIEEFFSTHRRQVLANERLRKAAVLMLLYPKDGELHVLLTRRTDEVEHHKGQISFPGGSMDDGDENLIQTALRESEEEVGLPRTLPRVLGVYDEYETPSGFAITPVVAYADALPALNHSADEVAEVLEVPLSLFLKPENERIEKRKRMGRLLDVYFYRYGAHEVWGATAAILRSFLNAVRRGMK